MLTVHVSYSSLYLLAYLLSYLYSLGMASSLKEACQKCELLQL